MCIKLEINQGYTTMQVNQSSKKFMCNTEISGTDMESEQKMAQGGFHDEIRNSALPSSKRSTNLCPGESKSRKPL
jgi:hypothetical protein